MRARSEAGGTRAGHRGPPSATSADAGTAGTKPWFKRRGWLISGALVVMVAVAVIVDLPEHQNRPGQISDDTSVMSQVNSDIGPCSYALKESFIIYRRLVAHNLKPSEVGQVPSLLSQDQTACSYADDNIYQLSQIDIPNSPSGKYMGQVINSVTLWATADALAVIEEIQAVAAKPADFKAPSTRARKRLARFEELLTQDRAKAEAELARANSMLQTRLPALNLTRVPASQ